MTRIAVAMSGGVDSSVTAALLLEQGCDVFGITMLVVPENEALNDNVPLMAQNVARKLGMPHHVVDLRAFFKENIISYFCSQYEVGKTPNPCVRCNRFVKFGLLYDKARELGADLLVTGHYVRIEQVNSKCILKKGIDPKRDQSYFLYRLTQEQLSRTLFPLGDITKDTVRQKAQELQLPTAESESREICFIPDNDYRRFLKTQSSKSQKPGEIVDKSGKVLGKHEGIAHYTIGQRHGLGISAAQPLYVVGIDPKTNRVTVGEKGDLLSDVATVSVVNWVSISEPAGQINATVKIRYLHPGAEATVTPLPNHEARIKFTEPQSAITPGQAAVFYNGDIVLGGGTIE